MNLIEVTRAMNQLRISGMAATLEHRLLQAQTEGWPALDFISALIQDELVRRQDRLLERWQKKAEFRDRSKTLDAFDFTFNAKMDRRLTRAQLDTGAGARTRRGTGLVRKRTGTGRAPARHGCWREDQTGQGAG